MWCNAYDICYREGDSLPWTNQKKTTSHRNEQLVKGPIMITVSCLSVACFYILQTTTLRVYPAGISLVTLMCFTGSVQSMVITFIVERGNYSVWAVHKEIVLFFYIYSGLIGTAFLFYVSGQIMKQKGPVFLTTFGPLSMVIVAFLSSFIFAEQLNVGSVVGAAIICIGLYVVVWGKAKENKSSPPLIVENPTEVVVMKDQVAEAKIEEEKVVYEFQ